MMVLCAVRTKLSRSRRSFRTREFPFELRPSNGHHYGFSSLRHDKCWHKCLRKPVLSSAAAMLFIRQTTAFAIVSSSLLVQLILSQCVYNGRLYNNAEQLPSKDPCEFCMCYHDNVLCLSQPCPPPAVGCQEVIINGFCCPLYNCPSEINLFAKNVSVLKAPANSLAAAGQLDLSDRSDPRSDSKQHSLPLPLLRATKP
ncbi:uncharacterized protein LOC111251787 isoform X2 [Varroa destructor]|uniref:VWFC domain-containing protein n=1 Tax=Varroa destructor TaxID=109461 RepID=A0A7M7KDC7_VARDE|nr:uncharacterized protein LOC111251787 isoform X2 [Varroa destructor]